jgi:hypothetical protein
MDDTGPGSALGTVRGSVSRPKQGGEPGSLYLADTQGGGVRWMTPTPDRRSAPPGDPFPGRSGAQSRDRFVSRTPKVAVFDG